MTEHVRIYVNGRGVDAPRESSVLEAIEVFDAAEAALIRHGEKLITDSRGLPTDPATRIYSGAIFRIVRARAAGDDPKES